MQACDNARQNFPTLEKSTARALCSFLNDFVNFVDVVNKHKFYIYYLVVLINLFHVIVLTRPSMRTSSINIIMTAVAIADIISAIYNIHLKIVLILTDIYPCYSKNLYHNLIILDNCLYCLQDYTRRCSTWLSLSIATIRTLVVRNPMDPKYEKLSNPKTAVIVIFTICSLCLPTTVLQYFKAGFIENEEANACKGNEMVDEYYYRGLSDLFMDNEMLIYNIFFYLEGVTSKVRYFKFENV